MSVIASDVNEYPRSSIASRQNIIHNPTTIQRIRTQLLPHHHWKILRDHSELSLCALWGTGGQASSPGDEVPQVRTRGLKVPAPVSPLVHNSSSRKSKHTKKSHRSTHRLLQAATAAAAQ